MTSLWDAIWSAMDGPLVFLTSTSGSVPSGRNARTVARSAMVRQTNHSKFRRGTFNVYRATHTQDGTQLHRRTKADAQNAENHRRLAPTDKVSTEELTEHIPRILGPQSIAIDGLVAAATSKIRHAFAITIKDQPYRVRDAIRRTQWATAAFALGTLRLTPEVHSAVEYLEHKVLTEAQSRRSHEIELQKYEVALLELQRSLRDPERRMQPSVLAASHILAICEMLDDSIGTRYLKFVDGIVALSNLQACRGDYYARAHVQSRAGAILVEALLTKRDNAMLDQPWSQILRSAGDKGNLSPIDASSFADSADLIFDTQFLTDTTIASLGMGNERQIAATKARKLHAIIKQSIQNVMLPSNRAKYVCSDVAILGERLAVMLGLDDFISQVEVADQDVSDQVHDGSHSFYTDMICVI